MAQGEFTGKIGNFFVDGSFDPNSVETISNHELLPAGDYPVMVESSEVKPNKKKTGHILAVQFEVVDGPKKGKKLFANFNLANPSEVAVKIGLKELGALCKATIGGALFTDEAQLLQQSCIACVKIKDNENSIRTYKSVAEVQAAGRGVRPQQMQQQQQQMQQAQPQQVQQMQYPQSQQPVQQQQQMPQQQQSQAAHDANVQQQVQPNPLVGLQHASQQSITQQPNDVPWAKK